MGKVCDGKGVEIEVCTEREREKEERRVHNIEKNTQWRVITNTVYSLGWICRVIFCWLSRHSRSLFSAIVSLCSRMETVCVGSYMAYDVCTLELLGRHASSYMHACMQMHTTIMNFRWSQCRKCADCNFMINACCTCNLIST